MDTKRDEIQKDIAGAIKDKCMYGIAYVAPRVGKIKITLDCIGKEDNVIVAYPESSIKKSWQQDIKRWKHKGKKVKYSTFMSFKKVDEPCDILVIDEIHLLSRAQMLAVATYIKKYRPKKVLGLTGTLEDKTADDLRNILNLKVIVKYSIGEAVRDGVITDYRIEVYFTPLSDERNIRVEWSKGVFYTSEKKSYDNLSKKIEVEQNPTNRKRHRLTRMSIIKKSSAKMNLTRRILAGLPDKRVLVFTGLTEIADSLGIASYHSKSADDSEAYDFVEGRIDKLAVVRQMNTGITFNKLDTAIINFFDSNAENMAQKISRITCMEYNTPDKVANIVIICSDEDQEKLWLEKALAFFDESKVKYMI